MCSKLVSEHTYYSIMNSIIPLVILKQNEYLLTGTVEGYCNFTVYNLNIYLKLGRRWIRDNACTSFAIQVLEKG